MYSSENKAEIIFFLIELHFLVVFNYAKLYFLLLEPYNY